MRTARINPDVQGVGSFFERPVLPRFREVNSFKQFLGGGLEPQVGSGLPNLVRDTTNYFCIKERLAILIEKNRDGNAPGSLARDAPIGPCLQKSLNAISSPFGSERDFVDRTHAIISDAVLVQRDKPLIHRAKHDRRFAPPAMWILVRIILQVQ